jgi:MFS family permease
MPVSIANAPPGTSTTKLAITVLTATSIEWYDFFLYGTAAALVFPATFFPATLPPMIALLTSFSTFSVGFIARPIGAALFGHLGDRHGRRPALALALVVMGLATMLIGCLPSYAAAGATAPVLLIVLRPLQGIAVGRQWGGAMLMITEHVPEAERGYYGSFAQAVARQLPPTSPSPASRACGVFSSCRIFPHPTSVVF